MQFVLDASVTMSWLFSDGGPAARAYARNVLDAVSDAATGAVVPVTWGLEVSNVVSRAEAGGLISQAQVEAFLEMLSDLRIRADGETWEQALSGTLHVARRFRLSAYDASYLELAMRAGLSLATLDAALRKAATKAGAGLFLSASRSN